MRSAVDRIAIARAQEQSDSARTASEIRWSQRAGSRSSGRTCFIPGCGAHLRMGYIQHQTCWRHRGIETRCGGFGDNERPRGVFVGRGYQLYLFYLPPIYQHIRKGRTMKTMAASKSKQIKAYTIQRRGGGWVMLTLLAEDADVVDESELDSRQACFTRLEDELRRLE